VELILIPILTGILAAFSGKWSKWISLAGGLAALILTLRILAGFQQGSGDFQFVFDTKWFSSAIHFKTGVDGISLILLLLTNILAPMIVLAAANKANADKPALFALIVAMQGALNGVFLALDGIMFYIFWELALIPVYFISAMWGEGDKFRTTLKFFIYTFIGSLAMLASLIYLYLKIPAAGSFDYMALVNVGLSEKEAIWVGSGLLLAFAVKIPLLPLHSWQPDTYTEAPAAGTMLLSAIMLKMGLYGLIRWFFPLVPEAIGIYAPLIVCAGVLGVVYGAIIAIRQNDMKRLVAFSSLSHVGLIAAGIATLSAEGIEGGILQMFSHGINVFGLFLAIDIIQGRAGTRKLSELGGIARQAPVFAAAFLIVVLAATAVPFTNGFPGELLLLKSVFSYQAVWGVFAGLTIIFCAVYMLRMYQFSMLGKETGGIYMFPDLNYREMLLFGVAIALILSFGVFPQWILELCAPAVKKTMDIIENTVGVLP
jgi:NADH-quinone oxidoreductase subunit M